MFKTLKSVSFAIIVLLAGIFISACSKETIVISIDGKATISKNPVKIGEEVYLSIASASSQTITENGKRVGVPKVHYFIDDNEGGSSNDPEKNFAIKYVVSLKEGTHELRAKAEPQDEDIKYTGSYRSTSFIVEAVKE